MGIDRPGDRSGDGPGDTPEDPDTTPLRRTRRGMDAPKGPTLRDLAAWDRAMGDDPEAWLAHARERAENAPKPTPDRPPPPDPAKRRDLPPPAPTIRPWPDPPPDGPRPRDAATTLIQRIEDGTNELDWRSEIADPPPGAPEPLDPGTLTDQEKLGSAWDPVPEAIRPDAVWLPGDSSELLDMMYGWNGKVGIRNNGEPLDGWGECEFLVAAWDTARDPEGIERCGMDDRDYGRPLEPGCDREQGCFRAYGQRPNPQHGGPPKEIQVHVRGDGRIMDAFPIPMD